MKGEVRGPESEVRELKADWRPQASPETEQFERDVFRTAPPELFPRGRDAYVIGTGPTLTPAVLAQIPRDAWLAVLNKGIIDVVSMGVPARLIDAWFCATPHYWRHSDWWPKANELARTHGIARVFSWQLAARGLECDYTFFNQPSFGGPADLCPPDLKPGVLRSGGTIGAHADQFCALSEATRAIHAGIDMRGQGYCDGSVNERAPITKPGERLDVAVSEADGVQRVEAIESAGGEKGEIGVYVRTLRACQRYGLKLATLTPTALGNYVEIEKLYEEQALGTRD